MRHRIVALAHHHSVFTSSYLTTATHLSATFLQNPLFPSATALKLDAQLITSFPLPSHQALCYDKLLRQADPRLLCPSAFAIFDSHHYFRQHTNIDLAALINRSDLSSTKHNKAPQTWLQWWENMPPTRCYAARWQSTRAKSLAAIK